MTASIRVDARSPNRLRPALDVLWQELGEIFRRALLRRHYFEAKLVRPFAHCRAFERMVHGGVELADGGVGRTFGQEERVPHARLDSRYALLTRGRDLRNDRDAMRR